MLRSLCFSGVCACWGAPVMSPLQTKDDRPMARLRVKEGVRKCEKEGCPSWGGGCLAHSPTAPIRAAAVVGLQFWEHVHAPRAKAEVTQVL